MSLYGALFAGVGGLKAQGTKMGIISDNIANVNTVGYKATKAAFETLVVNGASNVAYSPGGVIANNVQQVDKQGILTATDAPTDIAMSGAGFFVVNAQTNSSGEPLYTRAGSFRQDAEGNYVNPAGFFLQGWPLDREGNLPGPDSAINQTSSSNLDSLQTVNVQAQSGVASGTTLIEIGANLDANEAIYPGSGVDISMDAAGFNFGINAADLIVPGLANANNLTIQSADATTTPGSTFTVQTQSGLPVTFEYGGLTNTIDVVNGPAGTVVGTGNIFDASTVNESFFSDTSLSAYTTAARSFTIASESGGTQTFTYVSSSPNALTGEFNSLSTLAAAINAADGLVARVDTTTNQLYIGPERASDSMSFANVDSVGDGTLGGLDWVAALGVSDLTADPDDNRFNSMQSLADLVNDSVGISASISNPLTSSSLRIYANSPLESISFFDGEDNDNTTASATGGSLLSEFGLATNADFDNTGAENMIANIDASYDTQGDSNTSATGQNMASGDITPHFSRNVRVYDDLGGGHDVRISFLKTGIDTNNKSTWAVEIHAIPEDDVVTTAGFDSGQVAVGNISFNGDGTLYSVDSSLLNPVTIRWAQDLTNPEPSEITFDWGTYGPVFGQQADGADFGQSDGMSQFSSDYNVTFVNQNGAPVGELIGVVIDDDGFVIASYSNGETQALFKLPVADFDNPNGLQARSGNVYSQTQASGEVNLREAGSNGTGTVVSAALESSNVELAEELTDMIVAQRAYQASAKVISTSDELLEELNRL